jgi:putative flippase GtrA
MTFAFKLRSREKQIDEGHVSTICRVTRFITVGALGFVLQIAALAILISVVHWPWLPATIIAVQLAVVHNFLWHERWTWRGRASASVVTPERPPTARESPLTRPQRLIASVKPVSMRFVKFAVTTGVTSTAGNVALMATYAVVIGLPAIAANVAAVATLSILNFMMSDRWVFRSVRSPHLHLPCSSRLPRAHLPSSPSMTAFVVAVSAGCAMPAQAAPGPETVAAWNRYVANAESRMARETLSMPLSTDRARPDDQRGAPGSRGEPTLARCSSLIGCEGENISVPSGTINRWRGSVFVPGISLDQLLHRLQYPGTPPPQDDVAESRVLARRPDGLRVYIRLVRSAIVTVTYDTEHEMRFHRLGPALATARSEAARIEEVGGDDHGFLWRLNSYWRYRQTRDGVEVDLESLTLSRHVPAVVRPVAAPIVTRIARQSLVRTLEALRKYLAPTPTPSPAPTP